MFSSIFLAKFIVYMLYFILLQKYQAIQGIWTWRTIFIIILSCTSLLQKYPNQMFTSLAIQRESTWMIMFNYHQLCNLWWLGLGNWFQKPVETDVDVWIADAKTSFGYPLFSALRESFLNCYCLKNISVSETHQSSSPL